MYNGCQTDDTFVAFGLYTYEDTGPFVDLSNSPIAGGTGGRYVATLPIARCVFGSKGFETHGALVDTILLFVMAGINSTLTVSEERSTVFCLVYVYPRLTDFGNPSAQYFVAYETGAQLASYGMLALIGHRPSQYATFTFIDSQPTAGILKRRLERESRGESVPYHVHCQQGQTACHLGGTAWEVRLRRCNRNRIPDGCADDAVGVLASASTRKPI